MKNLVSFIFAAFAAVVLTSSCNNEAMELESGAAHSSVPVFFDVTESDTLLLNEEGTPIPGLRPERLVSKLTVDPEEVTVDEDMPWQLREESTKVPHQDQLGGKVSFMYNHGNELLTDSFYVGYKGRKLPFWRPQDLRIEAKTTSLEETSVSTHTIERYALTVKGLKKVFAEAQASLNTRVGYKPSFQKMIWDSWHFGPAVAEYANGEAIVTCPDSLHADELWDNGEYKNPLRKLTHSKNTFSVAVSGTEVSSLSAVVGKDLTVSGNKASVAEFTVTVNRTSKEIVEKSVPYAYNGKSINFVDSLHACGYKLKGGKVISKTNVRIIFVRENGTDEVSVDILVNITEKEKPHTPDFPGKIVFGYATDSYVNGTNMATWEGCYLHFGVVYNGTYKVYSRKVGTNDPWRETSVSADYITNVTDSKPAAFIGNTAGGYYLGYTKWWDQGSWCKIAYFTLGREADPERYLSSFNSTIKGENPNSYRMPLRGTWANGKITVKVNDTETVTYTITGTED